MTPLLETKDVAIPGRLSPAELRIDGAQRIALIGPNGSGKTSLLRAIAGADHCRGIVRIDGVMLEAAPPALRERLLGFVPASRDLIWPISVRDVVALGATRRDPAVVAQALEDFDLVHVADRPADRLSTGERSRVMLARALAARPRILLLDEPLANLDPYWVLRLLDILAARVASERSAIIVSLHALEQMRWFDRVLLMTGGAIVSDSKADETASSAAFQDSFGIEKDAAGWRIRTPADPRSSR